MFSVGLAGVGWLNTLVASIRNVRLLDSATLMLFWIFALKSHAPGPSIERRPSEPSCPGPEFRSTILPPASASAVSVHHWVRFDARAAHAGSGTRLYCC